MVIADDRWYDNGRNDIIMAGKKDGVSMVAV